MDVRWEAPSRGMGCVGVGDSKIQVKRSEGLKVSKNYKKEV